MSDTEKTGNGPSLADLEREIAANTQKPDPKPATAAKPAASTIPPAPPPRRSGGGGGGGGLLGGTALLLALGAAGLSGYSFWRDWTAPPPATADLSPLSDRIAALETREQGLRSALGSLTARLDTLESRLSGDTAVVTREPVPDADTSTAPHGTVDISVTEALADRIAALEDRKAETVDLGPLSHRVQTLEEVTAEVIPRLTMLKHGARWVPWARR